MFKAEEFAHHGWCWFITFAGIEHTGQYSWGISPAFINEEGRQLMTEQLAPLRRDVDFAFPEDSTLMVRTEEDAMMIWLKYFSP
jgi:hypothetical protein